VIFDMFTLTLLMDFRQEISIGNIFCDKM